MAPVGKLSGLVAVDGAQLRQIGKDLRHGAAELAVHLRHFTCGDHLTDLLGAHRGGHRRPADADDGDIRRTEGQRLEHLVLAGDAAGDGDIRQVQALLLQTAADGMDLHLHLDGGVAPLVHHLHRLLPLPPPAPSKVTISTPAAQAMRSTFSISWGS